MPKSILVILVGKRNKAAINVQKLLTEWGCMIKTRLGIHDGIFENFSEEGLIICGMVGELDKN